MSLKKELDKNRCEHIRADGKRCASPRAANHDSLCLHHWRQEDDFDRARNPEADAIVAQVLGTREQFKTATEINDGLAKVFALRGRKLISNRDAILFAYISQLLLCSLIKVHDEFTDVYTRDAWTRIVEKMLKHPGAKLPPLEPGAAPGSTLSPGEGSKRAVGAPSLRSRGGDVDVDLAPSSKHLRRKQKRRPLPKTGRQFAIQVFAEAAEDHAIREQRSEALLAEQEEADHAETKEEPTHATE